MSAAVPPVQYFEDESEAAEASVAVETEKAETPQAKRGPGRPKKIAAKEDPKVEAKSRSGVGGRWLVTMRHSPALRKSLIVQAATEEDAFEEFKRLNIEAAKKSKSAKARAKNVAAFERCIAEEEYVLSIVEAGSLPR